MILFDLLALVNLSFDIVLLFKDLLETHDLTILVENVGLLFALNNDKFIDFNLKLRSLLLHGLLHVEDFVVLRRSNLLAVLGKSINLGSVGSIQLLQSVIVFLIALVHVLIVGLLLSPELLRGFLL